MSRHFRNADTLQHLKALRLHWFCLPAWLWFTTYFYYHFSFYFYFLTVQDQCLTQKMVWTNNGVVMLCSTSGRCHLMSKTFCHSHALKLLANVSSKLSNRPVRTQPWDWFTSGHRSEVEQLYNECMAVRISIQLLQQWTNSFLVSIIHWVMLLRIFKRLHYLS